MSPMVSKRVIDDIRFRNNIVDVVSSYLPLQRTGATFKALCPFHREKTPSFHVNPERQIFHCFGCGAGGDVFRFVMQHENVDFLAAIRLLAQKAGVRLEYENGRPDEESDRSSLYALLEQAAAFYQRVLWQSDAGRAGRDYLARRELPEAIAREFGVGFAPDRWDSARLWAAKHKFSEDLLEAAGLIVRPTPPSTGRGPYDRFRNRLLFPIHDAQGRVIGFSGRILEADAKAAKYVNSPETAVFHKSQVLYAFHKAKKELAERREALVCEGQIDVIRCHLAGFRHAVAAQGTAFTEDHARMIRRYADGVALAFDADHAGQEASVKTARVFLRGGLAVRIVRMPEGDDPDSFIRVKGGEAFQRLIDGALSIVEFQVRVLGERENLDGEVGAMRAARAILQTLAETPNAVQRARMLQEAAGLLRLPPEALQSELRREQRRATAEPAGKPAAEKPVERPPEELQLAEYVVANTALGDLVKQYVPPKAFMDRSCSAIIEAAVDAAAAQRPLIDAIRERDDNDGALGRLAAAIEMNPRKTAREEVSVEAAVKQLILKIARRELGKKRDAIENNLRGAAPDRADTLRLERAQLTHDLKLLQSWEKALPVLEQWRA